MTTYGKDIDLTELQPAAIKFSAIDGAVAITQGQPVKWNGLAANTVIPSTTTTDVICGIAAEAATTAGDVLKVCGNGCLVRVPYTLTVGGKVGVGTSGTAGTLVNYISGTIVGTVVTGATLASVIRVGIQY